MFFFNGKNDHFCNFKKLLDMARLWFFRFCCVRKCLMLLMFWRLWNCEKSCFWMGQRSLFKIFFFKNAWHGTPLKCFRFCCVRKCLILFMFWGVGKSDNDGFEKTQRKKTTTKTISAEPCPARGRFFFFLNACWDFSRHFGRHLQRMKHVGRHFGKHFGRHFGRRFLSTQGISEHGNCSRDLRAEGFGSTGTVW